MNCPSLSITTEVSPGSNINDACSEAVALANKLGVVVGFDFNGVLCGARPEDDPELLVANFHRAMQGKRTPRIAFANPL